MTKEKIVTSKIDLHYLNNIIFIASAIIFNMGVSVLYLASKFDNEFLLQIFGAIIVLLSIPFTISFIVYIKKKAEKKIIISLAIILFYLVVEIVLDYILKIPFRNILALHITYIIIFYAAAFSIIGVSTFRMSHPICITKRVTLSTCMPDTSRTEVAPEISHKSFLMDSYSES